jgi:hypothetical protein
MGSTDSCNWIHVSLFVVNPEGKRPLGRPIHRREDNNKIDLKEIMWEGVDWIDLAQNRHRCWALANKVMNPRVA